MLLKYVLGSSSAALLRFIAFLILIKAVGVDDYGSIAFYLSIATIASTFAPLGSYNSTIRKAQSGESLKSILFYFISPTLFISALFLIFSFYLKDTKLFIYIYVAELLGSVLPSYLYAVINTTGNQIKSAISQFLGGLISLIISIDILINKKNYISWAQNYLLGSIIIFIIALFFLKKTYLGKNDSQIISISNLIKNTKNDIWNTLSIASRTLFFNIDRIILNYIIPQYVYGIYSICIRLTSSVYLLISNTIHYYESHFFLYGKEKKSAKIDELKLTCTKKATKTITIFFVLQLLAALILYQLVKFFSFSEYFTYELKIDYNDIYIWIYYYFTLMTLLYPMSKLWIYLYILNGLKMEKERMLILTCGSITSALFMFLLIPISYYLLPLALLIGYLVPIYLSKKTITARLSERDFI